VESVRADGWTTVLRSPRGRVVRADWRLDGQEKAARRAWSQRIDGTPFAKVLHERRVEARLAPADDGTRVTLALDVRPKRLAGRVLLRGPLRRELNEALAGLAREVEA
jgi:hypothetical protein